MTGKHEASAVPTEWEKAEIDRANASGLVPVVFVHGLWLLSSSWRRWRDLFEANGYTTLAPGWPDDPASVAEAYETPEVFAHKMVQQVTDHYLNAISQLDRKPVVIGHSFGGLIVQKIAGEGVSAVTVAIDNAPFRGVLPLPISALKSASPVLGNPANHGRAIALTLDQFRYGWANNLDDAEAKELYETFHVPASGAPLFQAAVANFNPFGGETKLDHKNPERGPLLVIAGDSDNTAPLAITDATYKIQAKNPGVTEIEYLTGRGHSLVIDHGWQEVAEVALAFAKTLRLMSEVLRVSWPAPGYCRATIDNPPLNLFDPDLVTALAALMTGLESDGATKVVVFDSANPEFILAHVDLIRAAEFDQTPQPATGLAAWPDLAIRFERAPFVTVSAIRGRARGVGSEFALATDIRFASRERTVLCHPEVGFGFIPGGGGSERLALSTGRARALEIILGAEDFDADTAERYGWVNRAIPDADFESFVDRWARRVAHFDRDAIAIAKSTLNSHGGLPDISWFAPSQQAFYQLLAQPRAQARLGDFLARGLQQDGDFELNLADHLAP